MPTLTFRLVGGNRDKERLPLPPEEHSPVYDVLAEVYPLSTLLFHSNAHKVAFHWLA